METKLNLREDGALLFHYPPKYTWEYNSDFSQTAQRWEDYHFYIHVPFCRNICNFCTFERRKVTKGSIEKFTKLLDMEMNNSKKADNFQNANIKSVYFGGGTASLLSNHNIDYILSRLRKDFGLKNKNIEITLECEPGTKSRTDLEKIRSSGVNRISIAVQAFNDKQLKTLKRSHTAEQSFRMISDAKEVGFQNIHIDLMYGLPGQSLSQWKDCLNRAVDLGIQHFSTYQLIVFARERLDYSLKHNKISERPSNDIIYKMRLSAEEILSRAGFKSYSTAEFALPDYECDYVKSSWDGSNYMGMGPGSYSKNGKFLWEDEVIHPIYEKLIKKGLRPVGKSIIMSPFELFKRNISMGLCLLNVNISDIEKKTGIKFWPIYSELIEELQNQKLVNFENNTLSITKYGVRFATHIMNSFANQQPNKEVLHG